MRQALYGTSGMSGQECRTVQRRQPCGHGRKHIEPWPGIRRPGAAVQGYDKREGVREGRLFGLEQMAEEERDNGVRMQCPCPSEFEESKAEDPLPSRVGLGFYTLLNMVERYIKAEGLTGKRKKDIRMGLEKPIWTAFVSWATAEYDRHPKGSAISGALGYLLKRRKELMAYLKNQMMPVDNNACERGFKPLVKGRKTSLFFQNLMGAWRASMMYSFFETCAMNHLNPQQWLTYVLNNIKTTPEDRLPNLLPQNFDKSLLKLV